MGEWSLWILFCLGLMGWLFEAIRSRRKMQSLEHELCEALCENEKRQQNRPLMSDEMLAVLRPGDMVLMIPPFDGMSEAHRRMFVRQVEEAAGAQAEAERLGLTPLHADYPSDARLGVEPGDWRLKWPAAKLRIEREMSTNA